MTAKVNENCNEPIALESIEWLWIITSNEWIKVYEPYMDGHWPSHTHKKGFRFFNQILSFQVEMTYYFVAGFFFC